MNGSSTYARKYRIYINVPYTVKILRKSGTFGHTCALSAYYYELL